MPDDPPKRRKGWMGIHLDLLATCLTILEDPRVGADTKSKASHIAERILDDIDVYLHPPKAPIN